MFFKKFMFIAVFVVLTLLGLSPLTHADGEQTFYYPNAGGTDNVFYNTLFGLGTFTPGNIKKVIWQDPGSSALGSIDGQITSLMSGGNNYDWATGIWEYDQYPSHGTATINIPANTTVAGEYDGIGLGYAAGIESAIQYGYAGTPALVVNNSGTVSGAVYWNDGLAVGLDSNVDFGDQDITNNSYSNFTANANWYTTGIHARSNYGDLSVDQYGSSTATSTGGTKGTYANAGWAVGLDLETVIGNITVDNTGDTTGTVNSSGGQSCGAYLWANTDSSNPYYRPNTGNLTLYNWGTFNADSPSGATAKGVYCGGNGQSVTVNNYGSGTISATGSPGAGYALGVEADGSATINVLNDGAITGTTVPGLFLTSTLQNGNPNSGGQGLATIRNWGNIQGSWGIGSGAYPGPITIYDHGTITGNGNAIAMYGGGVDNIYLYGIPSINGTMYSNNSSSVLNLHIVAPIDSISGGNGRSSSNLANDGLGMSGSITAGGKTYSWNNMNVTGSTAATHIANGTYEIENRNSGLAFDEPYNQTLNGTMIEQYYFWNGPNQLWYITNLGNGLYSIRNQQSGRYLDDYAWGTGDGNGIDVWDGNNQENQQWLFTSTDSGYYTISSAWVPGSCIDIPYASKSDLAALQLYTLDDHDASPNGGWGQQWQLISK